MKVAQETSNILNSITVKLRYGEHQLPTSPICTRCHHAFRCHKINNAH